MLYINEKTKEYPIDIEEIKKLYPLNTSFPVDFVPGEDYKVVNQVNVPDHDREIQEVVETAPVKIDGKWYMTYKVVSKFKDKVNSDGSTITAKEQEDSILLQRQINSVVSAKENLANAVRNRLDVFAQQYGYDNIISACSYVNSTVPAFANEAHTFIKLRDSTWVVANKILSDIGDGTVPSTIEYEDIKDILPTLVI